MILSHKKNSILSALNLLEDFANRKASGLLKVSANGVSWFIHFNNGKIFYANFSIDPLDRLELYICLLFKLRHHSINQRVFVDLREQTSGFSLDDYYPSYDYQTLYSLVCTEQISVGDGAAIVREITKEALRSFLLLSNFSYDFIADQRQFPILWSTNFLSLSKECRAEISDWQALGSKIYSPYQRPFLLENNEFQNKYDYLQKFLVGVDFSHLALPLNKPAIRVAQSLEPLITTGIVGLRSPEPPYNKMPPLFQEASDLEDLSLDTIVATLYKIVCVDDSPTILQRIHDFLDSAYFQLFPVQDPCAALSKIINVKPHAILMDIDMPNIDGYQLCTMVRRNEQFENTPIIMVTSNSGLIDRARAKFCGATDYLTKPFTQNSLNEMVLKYMVN
jgi:two-component system, chemotaxis family, response regulator PixG